MAKGTPATRAVTAAGVAHRVHTYAHDRSATDYGAEAARELDVEPARIFKTLVVALADGRHAVAVVPVTATLDLKAVAAAFGAKQAAMADPADAQRLTGSVVGGISPVGQKRRLPTAVDATATQWPTVFVSAGARGVELELAPDDLARLTDAILAPIARV
ncbi:MAG TPA: Cys-tRNA(Pro) deacylase [Acidimicrobiia bacterium]|nr:Cys-tRNA(Pro) deacylase [Acidimicrobiia bacterium]